MTAHDAPALQREQIDGVLVVIGIDLAAVGPAQRLPVPLLDEDVVAQPEMLFEDVLVKVAIDRGNCVNHENPHSASMGERICQKRQVRYWEISQYGAYGLMILFRIASATACVRLTAPSLRAAVARCSSAVRCVMCRISPI